MWRNFKRSTISENYFSATILHNLSPPVSGSHFHSTSVPKDGGQVAKHGPCPRIAGGTPHQGCGSTKARNRIQGEAKTFKKYDRENLQPEAAAVKLR
jgi:hypothetical protein